jgi:P27 family predicted phage terminase small subunit
MPTRLKLLRGNPGRRPLTVDEPQPDVLSETVPPELVDDVTAADEWTRTIVPAIRRRQITAADRTLAIAHCELFATWRSQLAAAARHAHIIAAGRDKYPKQNPARLMAHSTLRLLIAVDSELGLSPASRTRVSVAPPEAPSSKWAGLLD